MVELWTKFVAKNRVFYVCFTGTHSTYAAISGMQAKNQPLKEIVVGYQGNMIISCIVIGVFSQVNFRVV